MPTDILHDLRRALIQSARQLLKLEAYMIEQGILPKERETVIIFYEKKELPPSPTAAHTEK